MTTAYFFHPVCEKHEMADGHPECPQRLAAIEDQLKALGIYDFLLHREAPLVGREALLRVHTEAHVDSMFARAPLEGFVPVDPDTCMNPFTLEAAQRAAGAVVEATRMVIEGAAQNGFCNVRPPGHHAERATAMGFCFFNNVAVAAAYALEVGGLERVAVVDFDVHHGNGTEDIFWHDHRVMVCSSYQHPLYPYSGAPSIPGHIVNTPLPAGTGGEGFRDAVLSRWLPELESFAPQLILISAGFDGHVADPLANLALTESDYVWITQILLDLARRHAGGRVVSTLEGGYDLGALGRSAARHVRALYDA
ncbi:MAG: histone deacetylase family protein [Chromatiales bacterium]|nr:histone deacetylase family protein [Chromatiales bacterium]MDH3893488.1 histone deacetylase family protein [Chromatiales bacterium]MDH3931591.1 histone deacetylase family protein [Chromatiales bacterium]MDH4014396.1 histone deacetylase family protein [Chromatiales bacterium]PLX56402.1 MAG: deacetylase [Chromatiales bacterium]